MEKLEYTLNDVLVELSEDTNISENPQERKALAFGFLGCTGGLTM